MLQYKEKQKRRWKEAQLRVEPLSLTLETNDHIYTNCRGHCDATTFGPRALQ